MSEIFDIPIVDEKSEEQVSFSDEDVVKIISRDEETDFDLENIVVNRGGVNSFIPLPNPLIGIIASYIGEEDNIELLSEGFYSRSNLSHIDLDLSTRVLNTASIMSIIDKLVLFKSLSLNIILRNREDRKFIIGIAPKIKTLAINSLNKKDLKWLKLCPLTKLEVIYHERLNPNPFSLFPNLEEVTFRSYCPTSSEIELKENRIKKLTIYDFVKGSLDYISKMTNLEELLLSTKNMGVVSGNYNWDITDLGLENCKKLKTISIYGFNGLTRLDFINELPLLETFNYFGRVNKFGDNKEPIVINNTSLRKLDINGFENEEYDFSNCKNLEYLSLSCEAKILKLEGTSLRDLRLSDLDINNLDFLSSCPHLLNLTVEQINTGTNFNLGGLIHCKKLTSLSFIVNNNPILSGKEAISTLINLESFYCSFPIEDANFLSPCVNLTNLELSGADYSLELSFLKDMTKLVSLKISNFLLENEYYLENCINLKHLNVEVERNISFLSKLTSLESLKLEGCSSITSLKPISRCTKLIQLTLTDSSRLRTLTGIEGCKKLEMLKLLRSGVRDISKMEYCPSLRKIELIETDVEDVSPLLKCTNPVSVSLEGSYKIRNRELLEKSSNIFLISY